MAVTLRIDSFGATTLHNGTTRQSKGPITALFRADIVLIEQPGGDIYDANGTAAAALVALPFTIELAVISTTAADCETAVEAIFDTQGATRTVTGTRLSSGTTMTTTARLETVEETTPFLFGPAPTTRYLRLVFRPTGAGWV